jgi:hypothetical protein
MSGPERAREYFLRNRLQSDQTNDRILLLLEERKVASVASRAEFDTKSGAIAWLQLGPQEKMVSKRNHSAERLQANATNWLPTGYTPARSILQRHC